MNNPQNSDELEQFAWQSEDAGKEVYVCRHDIGIIEYVECDGKEYLNPVFIDEVRDAYETESNFRIAEREWRA